MTDQELEKQAERHLTQPYQTNLIEAFVMGARYAQGEDYAAIQSLSDDLMSAHNSEDWQEVAHIALDVIPRMIM